MVWPFSPRPTDKGDANKINEPQNEIENGNKNKSSPSNFEGQSQKFENTHDIKIYNFKQNGQKFGHHNFDLKSAQKILPRRNMPLPPESIRTKPGQHQFTEIPEISFTGEKSESGRSSFRVNASHSYALEDNLASSYITRYSLLTCTTLSSMCYFGYLYWRGNNIVLPKILANFRISPWNKRRLYRNYIATSIIKSAAMNLFLFILAFNLINASYNGNFFYINQRADRFNLINRLDRHLIKSVSALDLHKYESVKYPSVGEAAVNLGLDVRLAKMDRKIEGYTDDIRWGEYFKSLQKKVDNRRLYSYSTSTS